MRQSSIRQSVAASRQSHLPPQSSNPAVAAKLAEKKKEFEAIQALERASGEFLRRVDVLGDDFEVLADAGRVFGQVMEQWPNMFRILNLYLAAREQGTETDADADTPGERLVRVPIDEVPDAGRTR